MRLRNSLFRTAVDKFLNRAADAAARLRTEIGQLGKHATKVIQLTIARPGVDASFLPRGQTPDGRAPGTRSSHMTHFGWVYR